MIALLIVLVLTPLAIRVAPRLGLVAHPDRDRDIHLRPTARLGGPVLLVAFAAAAVATLGLTGSVQNLLLLCAATCLIFLADDKAGLPAGIKILLNLVIALAAVVVFGFTISYLTLPGVGTVNLALWISVPLSLFWLLGMQNTVNLLDGVDGLAAGVVGIVAVLLLIAASTRAQHEIVLMAAALAGACLGFLVFNFHPARIFMGDAGSQFLGLALALLSIAGVAKVAVAFALVVPALALAVPIIDTGWAILRRRRSGLSIAHADTRHIHHQLLDFGLTQQQTCFLFYAATGILGALGLMLFGHRRALAVAIVLLVAAISTVGGERLFESGWRIPIPGFRRLVGIPSMSEPPIR